jgi:uncharacterized protein YgiM (DUF1202 family)
MERSQTLISWITTGTLLLAWSSEAAAITPEQTRVCTNAVILELNGVPRSEVTVSSDAVSDSSGDWIVNWQTQDGRSGSCWVSPDHSVTHFVVDQSGISHPRPTAIYTVPDRVGATVTVATEGGELNVRQSPGGEVIGAVANGSTLVLTGRTSGEWVELADGGWVSRLLISSTDPSGMDSLSSNPQPLTEPGEPSDGGGSKAVVATGGSGLYLRQAPNGEVIDSLADGTTVVLTGNRQNGWVEVEGRGWVSETYLQYP